jgi:hypothetical protein
MGANAVTTVPVYVAAEVLTAADLNITNSGIPVFATTVTRDAAFGGAGEKTLAEGQFAYIEATDTTQYYDGAAWQSVAAAETIAIFNETQASNTQGGSSVATTYTKRTLNTTVINNIGATLTSSVIALVAGTYKVFAMSPFFIVGAVAIRLRNTTDGTTTVAGVNNYVSPSSSAGCNALLDGTFTITATKNFEVQYYCSSAQASNGLGVGVNSAGVSEIYTQITIVKVG